MTEPTPAKVAADKARATYRKTAEEFEQFTKDGQMPEAMRVFAEKNIAQSREIYERSKDALESVLESWERTFDAAGQGAVALNRKVIDITQRNINSGFDFAKSLAGAKTLAEAMELHSTYWSKQLNALRAQAEEMRDLSTRVTVRRRRAGQGASQARHGRVRKDALSAKANEKGPARRPALSLSRRCLSDAEHGARHRARPLAHAAAVIARFDDPLAARAAAGDHADMMRPDHHRANLRAADGRPQCAQLRARLSSGPPPFCVRIHQPHQRDGLRADALRRIGRAGGPMRRLISGRFAGGMMRGGLATPDAVCRTSRRRTAGISNTTPDRHPGFAPLRHRAEEAPSRQAASRQK